MLKKNLICLYIPRELEIEKSTMKLDFGARSVVINCFLIFIYLFIEKSLYMVPDNHASETLYLYKYSSPSHAPAHIRLSVGHMSTLRLTWFGLQLPRGLCANWGLHTYRRIASHVCPVPWQ